jgi:6-phospho-3-hexuloisomerase
MANHPATVLREIGALLERLRPEELSHFADRLAAAPRVMAFASGRSGFLLRPFIMRLNHLGRSAFFVGDASTPPVAAGDLFLVVSGSGSTGTTLGAAMEAAKLGATVAAIVGSRVSPLGQLAEVLLELPAPHKRGVAAGGLSSAQTAGSLFEQTAFVLLEGIVLRLFNDSGADREQALARHANLE